MGSIQSTNDDPTIENNNSNVNQVAGAATILNNNPNIYVHSSPGTTVTYGHVNHPGISAPNELDLIQAAISAALKPRHVPGATYDAQFGKGCMKGTRLQILSDIENWLLSPKAQQIFWLVGMAGTGKTAIAQTVCLQICEHTGIMLGGSFFCSRSAGSLSQRDVRCIVPTLAQLMARQSVEFSKALAAELTRDPDILHKQVSVQVKQLLHTPLLALRNSKLPIVFVIDALDECGGQSTADEPESHWIVSQMIEALVEFSRSPVMLPVKFLVTSRPETHIRDTLVSDVTFRTVLYLHTVNKAQVDADIRLYILTELTSSPRLQSQFTEADANMLTKLCDGLFIVATTALQYTLGSGVDASPSRFKRLLNAAGDGLNSQAAAPLDRMYGLIVTDAAKNVQTEADELEAMLQLLASILSARTALSVVMLADLLGTEKDDVRARLSGLHAVVHVTDDDLERSLRPLHASFGDYLFDRAPNYIRISTSLGHDIIARGCLRVMTERLHFNVSQSHSSYEPNSATRPDSITMSLEYACLQWVYHIAGATVPSEFDPEIFSAFRPRFLFWLEVVSVLGKMDRATAMLFFGASTVHLPELSEFLRDAHTFVTSSLEAIKQSAPHIYISALPFSAKDSLIYRMFSPCCDGLISVAAVGVSRRRDRYIMSLIGHEDVVRSVAYSPDGLFIASGSNDGTVRIWNVSTGEEAMPSLYSGHGIVRSVAFSPSGKSVAAGTKAGYVCIVASPGSRATLRWLSGHSGMVCSVIFSPDGARLASASADKTIRIWRIDTGHSIVVSGLQIVREVAFSADGSTLASVSYDYVVRLWNAITGQPEGQLKPHRPEGIPYSVSFSSRGTNLVSAVAGGRIAVWNVSTKELISSYCTVIPVNCVRFSPDGQSLVSTAGDTNAYIWTIKSSEYMEPSIILGGHKRQVHSASFSPDGLLVATAAADNTIRVWDASNRSKSAQPMQPEPRSVTNPAVNLLVVSRDGSFMVYGLKDCAVLVLNTQTRKQRFAPMRGHTSLVKWADISSNGQLIASASEDNTVRLWNARTGAPVGHPFTRYADGVRAMALSPDARWLASGSTGGVMCLCDVASDQRSNIIPFKDTGTVQAIAFSPDSRVFVAGYNTGYIHLWQAEDVCSLWESLDPKGGVIYSVSFSPDATRLVSGGGGGILVWNANTGELIRALGIETQINGRASIKLAYNAMSVACSPDGRFICGGSSDGSVQLWDGLTGESNATLKGPGFSVTFVAFTPDGRSIVSFGGRNTRVWDVDQIRLQYSSRSGDPDMALGSSALKDGWLTGPSEERLLWVPAEYQKYLVNLPCIAFIDETGNSVTIRSEGWYHGTKWTRCWLNDARP